MTPEELMKPRYKVIADYPKSIHQVGTIIDAGWRSEDLLYCDHDGPRCRHYPHLFKPLQWWQEREEKDMPEYVKLTTTRPSYGLPVGHISRVSFEKSGDGIKWIVDMFPVYVRVDDVTPSTLEEYNDYLTNKTK